METIGEFVRRTGGPVVPFVPDWYPWVYAHHYLRGEVGRLPGELVLVSPSLSWTRPATSSRSGVA